MLKNQEFASCEVIGHCLGARLSEHAGRISQFANGTPLFCRTESCFWLKRTMVWKDDQFGYKQAAHWLTGRSAIRKAGSDK